MQLTLDTSNNLYQIRSYEPGKIVVNDEIITTPVIITPEKMLAPWEVPLFNELQLIHLQPVFDVMPAIVLLGSGVQQQFLQPALLSEFYQRKIGVEVMNSHAACRTYNVLTAEGRKVAAALFLR